MSVRFQPWFVPSLLVILSAASFTPSLKAQDLTNTKPTSQNEAITQTTETEVKPRVIETQPTQNGNTTTNCQGQTPPLRQPNVSNPTNMINPSEIQTPIEEGTDLLTPVPQPQPISPNR